MSYAVYTTRGFVLGSSPSGEASKRYVIYTEDFGMVHARAQSVRLLSSKLRYNLEDFSFCVLSLVKGKETWRITGADRLCQRAYPRLILLFRARALNLVKRLVHGEERNDALFRALSSMFETDIDPFDVSAFESLTLVKVLSSLGYMEDTISSMKDVKARQKEVIQAINKALEETQL